VLEPLQSGGFPLQISPIPWSSIMMTTRWSKCDPDGGVARAGRICPDVRTSENVRRMMKLWVIRFFRLGLFVLRAVTDFSDSQAKL